jgi:hypothetical protein
MRVVRHQYKLDVYLTLMFQSMASDVEEDKLTSLWIIRPIGNFDEYCFVDHGPLKYLANYSKT